MSNQNLTDITFLLDRSRSMETVRDQVIAAFNEFLGDQKAAPGEAVLTLVQFNDQIETKFTSRPIDKVSPITHADYVPASLTALRDAIGQTIFKTGERLKSLPENERPAHVIFVIQTDGRDTAANQEYTNIDIRDAIDHQENVYNWSFVFLGANQDAIVSGGNLGVLPKNSLTYAHTPDGYTSAMGSVSRSITQMRCGTRDIKTAGFFDQGDRDVQSKIMSSADVPVSR